MPGHSPKAEVLVRFPGAVCKRVHSTAGITGYVIRLPGGKQIASGGTAARAWDAVRLPEGGA
jgi:hypothetical protein